MLRRIEALRNLVGDSEIAHAVIYGSKEEQADLDLKEEDDE